MSAASTDTVTRQALEGRLPVLPEERIYRSFASALWTWLTLAGGSWVFLVGVALPRIGSKEVGIAAYMAGTIIAFVAVMLSGGLPSARYGIETIEVTKSSLGVRGIVVPVIGLLVVLVGASDVLAAMTAVAIGNILKIATRANDDAGAGWIALFGLLTLFVVWAITTKGPRVFERIAEYVGPAIMMMSAGALWLIFLKLGVRHVFDSQVPPSAVIDHDKLKSFMLAFEWGAAVVLTFWPIVGGITRLQSKQDHILTPPVLAFGVICPLLPIAAAALGTVTTNTQDSMQWLVLAGGQAFGTMALAVIVVANIIVMVIQYYLAGVISQHIRLLTRVPWGLIVALLIMPGIYLAFWPKWVLNNFTTLLTYGGVVFAGTAGVTFADYFMLRRQQLEVEHLFTLSQEGRYHFWGGFNFVALAVIGFGFWFDLWLYDPISMSSRGAFRYIGATIPTLVACSALYYILMRAIGIPLGKGGYQTIISQNSPDSSDGRKVSLTL